MAYDINRCESSNGPYGENKRSVLMGLLYTRAAYAAYCVAASLLTPYAKTGSHTSSSFMGLCLMPYSEELPVFIKHSYPTLFAALIRLTKPSMLVRITCSSVPLTPPYTPAVAK